MHGVTRSEPGLPSFQPVHRSAGIPFGIGCGRSMDVPERGLCDLEVCWIVLESNRKCALSNMQHHSFLECRGSEKACAMFRSGLVL